MLQLVLYGLLAILIAGALFLIATRFLPAGEQIAPPLRDEPPWDLPPNRMLASTDVDAVRLPVALRGYRFAETDILLDRLAGELRQRDEEIARLRQHVMAQPAPTPTPTPTDTVGSAWVAPSDWLPPEGASEAPDSVDDAPADAVEPAVSDVPVDDVDGAADDAAANAAADAAADADDHAAYRPDPPSGRAQG